MKHNTISRFHATLILLSMSLTLPSAQANEENQGKLFYENAKYDLAESYFLKRLSEENSEYQLSLLYLSKISNKKGNGKRAIQYIEESLELMPNDVDEILTSGEIYCNRAMQVSLFSALKFGKKCKTQYDLAVQLFPSSTRALTTAIEFHITAPSIVGGSIAKAKLYLDKLEHVSKEDATFYNIILVEAEENEAAAIELAKQTDLSNFVNPKNKYNIALFLRNKQQTIEAKKYFSHIINTHAEAKNDWQVNDSYLQLGEIYCTEEANIEKGIALIKEYQKRNQDPFDVHYFWGYWSLAKAYFDLGHLSQYEELVEFIKKKDYKSNKDFKSAFEKGQKERKLQE